MDNLEQITQSSEFQASVKRLQDELERQRLAILTMGVPSQNFRNTASSTQAEVKHFMGVVFSG